MEIPKNKKVAPKTIWEIVGVAVVIVVAILIIQAVSTKQNEPEEQKTTETPQLKVEKTEVPTAQLPAQFPSDIPLEKGATIVQNYNAEAEDGRYQATRVFETSKSLAVNYELYTDFFSKNGWTIIASVNEPTQKVVSARNGNTYAQVSITENSVTKAKTVDISVTIVPSP